MDEPDTPPQVVDDAAGDRFVFVEDGVEAELLYELEGDRLILLHTGVPQQLGGRGIGGRLVEAAVARATRDGLTLVPWCPYARKWLGDHHDAVGDVPVDWSPPPALS